MSVPLNYAVGTVTRVRTLLEAYGPELNDEALHMLVNTLSAMRRRDACEAGEQETIASCERWIRRGR